MSYHKTVFMKPGNGIKRVFERVLLKLTLQ